MAGIIVGGFRSGYLPARLGIWIGKQALLLGCFLALLLVPATSHPAAAKRDQRASRAAENAPFSSTPIKMARATWDTGWFQAEIFKALIEDLGYSVRGPQTMDNLAFYQAAARGEVDLWVNGWFPSHNLFLKEEGVGSKVQPVGFQVMAGALQGYMVDKATAVAFNINSLDDLKKPKIAALFDGNGNGKADLVGCNVGWGCEQVIEHHLGVYDLRATVEHLQGDYAPLMDEAIRRYERGKPVLFFTWTPNWTVGRLIPDKNVVWLPVPFPSLPFDQQDMEEQTLIEDVAGCLSDPCAMGFPPNDIRAVANTDFLNRHPDIERLLELVKIPPDAISRQNDRMFQGEGEYSDIQRHARKWIDRHRETVETWLHEAEALQAAKDGQVPLPEGDAHAASQTHVLRVVTQRSEPFVIYRDNQYAGFSMELWEQIAGKLGLDYEVYSVNTIAKLLDEVRRGAADAAISGIGITAGREQILDFSHAYFESGLQIMVSDSSESLFGEVVLRAARTIFSKKLLYGVSIFVLVLLLAAHVIWLLERRHNPQFSETYPQGIWQAIWWAVVTVTTVGYGDKTPKGNIGRMFGLIWILAGYFVFAYFTASVSSTVTVRELHGTINGPEDLFGKRVATVQKSTAAAYLNHQGITAIELPDVDQIYRLLSTGRVEAVVYDAPVLQHYASHQGKGKVKIVGLIFKEKNYGIALPENSVLRDRINIALLELMESGAYETLAQKWFGQ